MDESILIKKLKEQDPSALEEIIRKYTRLISSIIGNMACGNLTDQDVEELTEDTFIALWYNAEKAEENKLKAYICQIAKNKTKNKLRDLGRHKVVSIESVTAEDDFAVSDETEAKNASLCLQEAINEIGDPDREIILRRYYYYQSSSAIGKIMGINPHTVRTKIARAKDKLRKILIERGFTL